MVQGYFRLVNEGVIPRLKKRGVVTRTWDERLCGGAAWPEPWLWLRDAPAHSEP